MKVCDLIAETIRQAGIGTMFGVMGDANMYIIDSFTQRAGGRFVSAAHEGGAVLMAGGYAAATGGVGVATVTHGAITNCVSALFDVVRGGYPVVVISGDTAQSDRYNLQNLPQSDIVSPTGAIHVTVGSADTVVGDISLAIRRARGEHRAVVVDLPADLQRQEAAAGASPMIPIIEAPIPPPREALEAVAGIALGSNRPVLLAGRGCAGPGAEMLLRKVAERLGAPVCTTLRGMGLFRDAEYNLGVCGTLANPVASEVIAHGDCLLAFGASLNPLTTMKGELLANKRVVQVDRDATALARFYPVELGVVGDAELVAQGLLDVLDDVADIPYRGSRLAEVASAVRVWRQEDRSPRDSSHGLHIRDALHLINGIAPANRYLSIDVGRFGHQALNILEVERPGRYIHASNIAQIGLSVGYGVGAALSPGGGPAVVITGDGGFMLGGLAEFNTAVRNNADLIVFVMNDGAYGAEYYRLIREELNPNPAMFNWPDFALVATALGGTGTTVADIEDFGRVRRCISERSGPVLVNVLLDPANVPDPGIH